MGAPFKWGDKGVKVYMRKGKVVYYASFQEADRICDSLEYTNDFFGFPFKSSKYKGKYVILYK